MENLPLGPLCYSITYLQQLLYIAWSKTMLWDRGQHNNHRKAVTTQKHQRQRQGDTKRKMCNKERHKTGKALPDLSHMTSEVINV